MSRSTLGFVYSGVSSVITEWIKVCAPFSKWVHPVVQYLFWFLALVAGWKWFENNLTINLHFDQGPIKTWHVNWVVLASTLVLIGLSSVSESRLPSQYGQISFWLTSCK